MAAACSPAKVRQVQEHNSVPQDQQDGLLPVVKFLESALAMKAKVCLCGHALI